MSSDDRIRYAQIREAGDALLLAIESRPDDNGEIAARAIRAAIRIATKDYRTAAVFAAVES